MDTVINPSAYSFSKEPDGRWYIDLPGYKGPKADLEMVSGADTMLDYVGEGHDNVKLILSEHPFEGSDVLKLIHDYSSQTGGGGIYFLDSYNGVTLNQEMWLCEVTEWVFGKLPKEIYLKMA